MNESKRLIISREDIARRVRELASQINKDYREKDPIMVGILKGAFIFLADLVRALDFPVEIDFVRLRSYGPGTTSSGDVRITKDLEVPIKNRHVIIVEDIVDIGYTLHYLRQHLNLQHPLSLKVCCLIDKKERRAVNVPLDYVGFAIEKGFLVGYGLDCGEKMRTLPEVYELVD
jgi:hypoxanthine phosphoribosyltransferase